MKYLFLVITAFVVFSCGNSVEKQTSKWESSKSTVQQYVAKYPYLADELNAQYAKAEKQMNDANSINDEKEKIKAMKSANSSVYSGTLAKVRDFERNINDLESEIDKLKGVSGEFTEKTTFLLDDAVTMLKDAKSTIAFNFVSPDSALSVFVEKAKKLYDEKKVLSSHYTELVKAQKEVEPQEELNDESKSEEVHDHAAHETTDKKEIAQIKCKKCGGKLQSDATKCKNCGAPVKK